MLWQQWRIQGGSQGSMEPPFQKFATFKPRLTEKKLSKNSTLVPTA